MIETTVDRRTTNFSLVVGVMESWSGMTLGYTNTIRIRCLWLDIGVEVVAYKNASSGLIVAPQSHRIGCCSTRCVCVTASQNTLSDTDISIISHRSNSRVEWTLCHTSLGCWITPGSLNSTASIT